MGASLGCGFSLTGVRLAPEVVDAIRENDLDKIFQRWSAHDATEAIKMFKGFQDGSWRVYWSEFFKVIENISRKIDSDQRAKTRSVWHPAVKEYAMEIGHFNKEEHYLRNFPQIDIESDDDASNEKQHQIFFPKKKKKNMSSSIQDDTSDEDLLLERRVKKKEGNSKPRRKKTKLEREREFRKKQENAENNRKRKKRKKRSKKTRPRSRKLLLKNDDNEDDEDAFNDGEDMDVDAFISDDEDDDEDWTDEDEIRIEYARKKLLKKAFDVKIMSPIFIGFSSRLASDLESEILSKSEKSVLEEDAYDPQDFSINDNELQEHLVSIEKEQKRRKDAQESRKERREKASLKREKERRTNEKALDPDEYKVYMKTWQGIEDKVKAKEKKEDALSLKKARENDMKANSKEKSLRQTYHTALRQESLLMEMPRGLVLYNRYQEQIGLMGRRWNQNKKKWKEKQEDLKEKTEGDDTISRGIIIMLQGEVDAAKKVFDESEEKLKYLRDKQAFAERLRVREAKFSVLFEAVLELTPDAANELGAPGADLRDIFLLVVFFCGKNSNNMYLPSSLREKMDWAYWHFKTSHEVGDEKMTKEDLLNLLVRATRGIESLANVEPSRRATNSELQGLVARAFKYDSGGTNFLSQHRFREWCLELIHSSMFFSELLGLPHRYTHMSEFQLLHMSCIEQVQAGMITMSNFINSMNKDATKFRPLLGNANKSRIHKRALLMGRSDPLKPNYADMMPRNTGGGGKTVALKHGWYENAEVHDNLILMKASEKIQTLFRGRQGRHGTIVTKERAALLKALKRAKQGAAERVRVEFEKKENMVGQRKVKWNAKVRMRQMKQSLSDKGKKPTRDDIIQLMMAEQIAVMWEKVERRFDDMARMKGLSDNAVNAFRTMIGNKVRPPPNLPDTERKRALVRAQEALPEAAELFRGGEESSEFLLRLEMARPDPSYTQLYERMRWMHKFVTEHKARNLLLECPSKRILLQKFRFWPLPQIAEHYVNNFNFREEWAVAFAKSLKRILHTDLEYGKMTNRALSLQRKRDATLKAMVEYRAGQALRVQKEAAERAILMAQSQEDPERAMQILEANKKKMRDKLEHLSQKVKRRMAAVEEAELKLKEAKREKERISKIVRVQEAVGDDANAALQMMQVSPDDRTNWVERFYHASEMPERTPAQKYEKYKEMHLVIDLFVDTAETHAKKIVKEFFMPRSEKLAKPFAVKKGDGGRFVREKFAFHGIRFKVLLDYHGVYNGNDQAAMKMGGAELRATMAYYRCNIPKLRVPLQCVVDFLGFRVLCTAILPIVHEERDKKGKLLGLQEKLVFGSIDRGFHVTMKNQDAQSYLKQAAARLNIKEHRVKGRDDMMACDAFTAFDTRCYVGTDGKFYILNPSRTFPPIDFDVLSKRLGQSSSARGQSIFWRHFRPELLHALDKPLSSDAFNLVAHNGDRIQAVKDGAECTAATHQLIHEIVTDFAEEVSNRSASEIEAIFWSGEMHTRGMNMRLLGEIRSRFWRKLDGTAGLEFGKKHILCNKDWRLEIRRGSQLRIGSSYYKVRADGEWDNIQIPVHPPVNDEPEGDIEVYAGEVKNEANSHAVRSSLLVEMAARALKGIIRVQARESARIQQLFSESAFAEVACHIFNLMTGAAPGYGKFWLEDVMLAIEERFGRFALSGIERWRLHTIMTENYLVPTLSRLCEMLKIEVTAPTKERFELQPVCFRFEVPDIHNVSARIRLSVEQLRHYSKGSVLAADAKMAGNTTYRARILTPKDGSDPPVGYWPLDDLVNSKHAKNLGSAGEKLNGRYSRAVRFRADGFVKNDSAEDALCSKGIAFVEGARAHVDFTASDLLCPMQPKVHFSIECWTKVTGAPQKEKVLIENGRFLLQASKANYWIFLVYMPLEMVNLRVKSPKPFEYNTWYHIVCTYDGGQCRMYINGHLVAFLDVTRSVKEAKEAHTKFRAKELIRIKDEENTESIKCEARARKVIAEELKNPEAKREMLKTAMKLYQETTLKISLSKKTDAELKEEGIIRITKRQAEDIVRQGLIRERQNSFMKDIQNSCNRRREAIQVDEEHMKSAMIERSRMPLRIGSSDGDGGKYFIGTVQQVAFYRIGLTAEHAHEHYLMGTSDLRLESDRLYYLASLSFKRVLNENPYDRNTLVAYASALCNHFGYGTDRKRGEAEYRARIKDALLMFRNGQNAAGAAAMFEGLPDTGDPTFADICLDIWEALKEINPAFFEDNVTKLAYIPIKFGLMRPGMPIKYVRCAAEIYQYALHVQPDIYNDIHLGWLHEIHDPRIVVFFVDRAQRMLPTDVIDLEDLEDAPASDLLAICYNCRNVLQLKLNRAEHLNDTILNSMTERMKFLEKLDIENCRTITDDAMQCLGESCGRLRRLNIAGCIRVSDLGLCEITKHCDDLRELDIRHCKFITDVSISSLAKGCCKLEYLDLTWCVHVTTKGVKSWADTAPFGSKLKELKMRGCSRIGDDAIFSVSKTFTCLTTLDLAHLPQLTDKSIKNLTHNCWQLEWLDLTNLPYITDDCFWFDEVGDGRPEAQRLMLRRISSIFLNDCISLSNHAILGIAKRAKSLHKLQLNSCTNLDVDSLWKNFFLDEEKGESRHLGLVEIDLGHILALSDQAIEGFIDNMINLEYISLAGCPKVSDASMSVIAQRMNRVHRLNLSFCTQITDAGLKVLAEQLFIEELDISHCKYVTDKGIGYISESFNTLRILNVTWDILLTDVSLASLSKCCPALKSCDISQCHRMTEDGIATFIKTMPGCDVIRKNLDRLFAPRGTDSQGLPLPDLAKENAAKLAELQLHYARTGQRTKKREPTEEEKLENEASILKTVIAAQKKMNPALMRAQKRNQSSLSSDSERSNNQEGSNIVEELR